MKRIKEIYSIVLVLGICICICMGCRQNDDSAYFNGEIQYIEDTIENIIHVKSDTVSLEGANYGWMAVHDSLMIFFNPKLADRFYNIFNINTGEEIGSFCNKGGGPDEVVAVGPIFQFFKEDDELKTLLFAVNEEKLLIWNITQSIKQATTIIDRVIPYAWRTENAGACYNEIFLQDKNTLLAKVSAISIGEDDATLPIIQKRTVDTNKCLKNYSTFKQSIKNGKASIMAESFFYSNDALKPDGTKVVQAMSHLPQLNIIDLQTGKVVGYRLGDEVDFSLFKGEKVIYNYYSRLRVDDNYIYATYWGKAPWGRYDISYINMIHVFDWNGKLVQKIAMDHAIAEMWIDPVRNRLYTTTPEADNVFYTDL